MSWYQRMNHAMEYIEHHLLDAIDFSEIATITQQSAASFQRTFSILMDMPISEYLRRRRMTRAAFEIQNSDCRVVTLALKYGYESPEAFARAFKELHGVSPTTARKEGHVLKSFPPITFLLTIKGANPMNYRIESKDAFTVYGIEGIFTSEDSKNSVDIPNFWLTGIEDGSFDKLRASTGDPKIGLHAVCGYRSTGENTFPYAVFAYKTKDSNTSGYTTIEVPAATWAIFTSEPHDVKDTSQQMQSLIKRVYSEWLPTAGYEKVDGHELELYLTDANGHCVGETWVRVQPK